MDETPQDDMMTFLKAWAWKREHRARFQRPYIHKVHVRRDDQTKTLRVQQAKFSAEGFASTVWDSSIVVAKYFERWQTSWLGKRCLDLSAGCGLPGLVLACLGAHVTATDLGPNLGLLRSNFETNGLTADIFEHRWGTDVLLLSPPYDVIVACGPEEVRLSKKTLKRRASADVMYVEDAVGALVDSLCALSSPQTQIFLAHGRNRQAEAAFLKACSGRLHVVDVSYDDLDPVYRCGDVKVCRLTLC